MWKLATNAIAVKGNLFRRGLTNVSQGCPICGEEESREHITFGCKWTRAIWFAMLGVRGGNNASQTMEQWLTERMNEPGSNRVVSNSRWSICMITCSYIWKARCKAMFEGVMPKSDTIILEIWGSFHRLHHWLKLKEKMGDGAHLAQER